MQKQPAQATAYPNNNNVIVIKAVTWNARYWRSGKPNSPQ
jgi:hypothetical protein